MRQPDIEIYLKDADQQAIAAWLSEAIGPCSEWRQQGQTFKCRAGEVPVTWLESSEPSYILYTSGTTGKPKGILHTTAGYLTGVYGTTKWVFDLKDEDLFWCTADVGWVTGHSYVVYGPLAAGATADSPLLATLSTTEALTTEVL